MFQGKKKRLFKDWTNQIHLVCSWTYENVRRKPNPTQYLTYLRHIPPLTRCGCRYCCCCGPLRWGLARNKQVNGLQVSLNFINASTTPPCLGIFCTAVSTPSSRPCGWRDFFSKVSPIIFYVKQVTLWAGSIFTPSALFEHLGRVPTDDVTDKIWKL